MQSQAQKKAVSNSDARWNASAALNEAIETQKQELPDSTQIAIDYERHRLFF